MLLLKFLKLFDPGHSDVRFNPSSTQEAEQADL